MVEELDLETWETVFLAISQPGGQYIEMIPELNKLIRCISERDKLPGSLSDQTYIFLNKTLPKVFPRVLDFGKVSYRELNVIFKFLQEIIVFIPWAFQNDYLDLTKLLMMALKKDTKLYKNNDFIPYQKLMQECTEDIENIILSMSLKLAELRDITLKDEEYIKYLYIFLGYVRLILNQKEQKITHQYVQAVINESNEYFFASRSISVDYLKKINDLAREYKFNFTEFNTACTSLFFGQRKIEDQVKLAEEISNGIIQINFKETTIAEMILTNKLHDSVIEILSNKLESAFQVKHAQRLWDLCQSANPRLRPILNSIESELIRMMHRGDLEVFILGVIDRPVSSNVDSYITLAKPPVPVDLRLRVLERAVEGGDSFLPPLLDGMKQLACRTTPPEVNRLMVDTALKQLSRRAAVGESLRLMRALVPFFDFDDAVEGAVVAAVDEDERGALDFLFDFLRRKRRFLARATAEALSERGTDQVFFFLERLLEDDLADARDKDLVELVLRSPKSLSLTFGRCAVRACEALGARSSSFPPPLFGAVERAFLGGGAECSRPAADFIAKALRGVGDLERVADYLLGLTERSETEEQRERVLVLVSRLVFEKKPVPAFMTTQNRDTLVNIQSGVGVDSLSVPSDISTGELKMSVGRRLGRDPAAIQVLYKGESVLKWETLQAMGFRSGEFLNVTSVQAGLAQRTNQNAVAAKGEAEIWMSYRREMKKVAVKPSASPLDVKRAAAKAFDEKAPKIKIGLRGMPLIELGSLDTIQLSPGDVFVVVANSEKTIPVVTREADPSEQCTAKAVPAKKEEKVSKEKGRRLADFLAERGYDKMLLRLDARGDVADTALRVIAEIGGPVEEQIGEVGDLLGFLAKADEAGGVESEFMLELLLKKPGVKFDSDECVLHLISILRRTRSSRAFRVLKEAAYSMPPTHIPDLCNLCIDGISRDSVALLFALRGGQEAAFEKWAMDRTGAILDSLGSAEGPLRQTISRMLAETSAGIRVFEEASEREIVDVCSSMAKGLVQTHCAEVKAAIVRLLPLSDAKSGRAFLEALKGSKASLEGPEQTALLKFLLRNTDLLPLAPLSYDRSMDPILESIASIKVARFSYEPDPPGQSAGGVCGMRNLGNTCYLNSVLQSLHNIGGFARDLENSAAVFRPLRDLFALMDRSKSVEPREFAEAWDGWYGAPIDVREQQDAVEFHAALLDSLPPEVSEWFKGEETSVITSADTGAVLQRSSQPFYALGVDVFGFDSLEESLRHLQVAEQLAYDGGDGVEVPATRVVQITELPRVLAIHLKRFSFDVRTHQRRRLGDRFSFPEALSVGPKSYVLSSFVCHAGSADGGHYSSVLRRGDGYVVASDLSSSRCPSYEAFFGDGGRGSCAYILYYVEAGEGGQAGGDREGSGEGDIELESAAFSDAIRRLVLDSERPGLVFRFFVNVILHSVAMEAETADRIKRLIERSPGEASMAAYSLRNEIAAAVASVGSPRLIDGAREVLEALVVHGTPQQIGPVALACLERASDRQMAADGQWKHVSLACDLAWLFVEANPAAGSLSVQLGLHGAAEAVVLTAADGSAPAAFREKVDLSGAVSVLFVLRDSLPRESLQRLRAVAGAARGLKGSDSDEFPRLLKFLEEKFGD